MKKNLLFFTLVLFLDFYSFAQWTQKADFIGSSNRSMAVGFSIGNKGYIGTGSEIYSCGMPAPCEKDYNDFWEYNPINNAWTKKANFGGEARIQAVGFSIGDKGYIGTGGRVGYKKDFWEYNPAIDSWTQKADFPGASRWAAVGFSIGNKGYLGLGIDGVSKFNDFWEYNPTNDTWTKKTDFPGVGRSGVVYFSIGNRGYIGLGLSNELIYDFWEYNPENDSWKRIADFPGSSRQVAKGFSSGTKGYVVAGHDGTYLKDLWEWDSATNTWSKKEDFGGSGRIHAVGFSIGSKAYFGTGNASDGYKKDFWEYNTVITSNSLSIDNTGFAKIFPNPANNKITIEYPKEFDIEIADLSGRQIDSYPQNKTSLIIDLNGYPKGIYFLKIISDHKICVEKIIKQ